VNRLSTLALWVPSCAFLPASTINPMRQGITSVARRSFAAHLLASTVLVPAPAPAPALVQPRPLDERIDSRTSFAQILREQAVRAAGPRPRSLPRRRIDIDFAVLLMRTSYATADELDFMPMDEFQKRQFLLRQDDWEGYRQPLPPVKQGDISDPNYFDFMSYCQYATIAAGMRDGRVVFEELIDANGTSIVVARDPALPRDNARLPALLSLRVGDKILDAIAERYPGLAPTVELRPSRAALLEGVKALAQVFEYNNYLLSARLEPSERGFQLSAIAPATVWSQQVLSLRGDLANDFEAKAIAAYLRRCAVDASYTTRYDGSEVVHIFVYA